MHEWNGARDRGQSDEDATAKGQDSRLLLRDDGDGVARSRDDFQHPSCEHGTWTFAGSDAKRGASKWRCPTGECQPASVWVKADRLHPLVPRESARFKCLYHQRGAVEREFGRLKHEWALLPLRVRRLDRVRLHADLSILGQLTVALDMARRAQETHGLPSAA